MYFISGSWKCVSNMIKKDSEKQDSVMNVENGLYNFHIMKWYTAESYFYRFKSYF